MKAAIGEDIDNETLGGATTHTEISGVTDYKVPNDAAALDKIRASASDAASMKVVGTAAGELVLTLD